MESDKFLVSENMYLYYFLNISNHYLFKCFSLPSSLSSPSGIPIHFVTVLAIVFIVFHSLFF